MKKYSYENFKSLFWYLLSMLFICRLNYYFKIVLSASSAKSFITKITFFWLGMTSFYPTLKIASIISIWPPLYLPISFMNMFITIISEIATQNRPICFSKSFYYSVLSYESNPSVSMMLILSMACSQTPLVHRPRTSVESKTGNFLLKTSFKNVLFPVPWVPKMAKVFLLLGYSVNSGLHKIEYTLFILSN